MSGSIPRVLPLSPRKPLQAIHNHQKGLKKESDSKKLERRLLSAKDHNQGIRLKIVEEEFSTMRAQMAEKDRRIDGLEAQMAEQARRHDAQLAEQGREIAELMKILQAQSGGTSKNQTSKK